MSKKTWIAGVGLVAAIAVGSLLLASVSPIGLAGAQDETDSSEDVAGSGNEAAGKRGGHDLLANALDQLVADGTIDQADADAVAEAVAERREEFRADHPGRRGRDRGPRLGGGPGGDELLEALGMTREELHDALADGQTLEEIAEAAGADLTELATDRLDAARARIDEALADGSISEARAERAQERIDRSREAIENGELPLRGPGHGHRWGPGGPADDADDD